MSGGSRKWYRVSGRRLVTHPVAVLCVLITTRCSAGAQSADYAGCADRGNVLSFDRH